MFNFMVCTRRSDTDGGVLGADAVSTVGLAGKYASAAFSAALKKKSILSSSSTLHNPILTRRECSSATLKQVETDLRGVHDSIKSEPSINEFLANPILSHKARAEGIDALLKKSSPKGASDITKNLFEVLAENGRLYETEHVIADFLELVAANKGEIKVTITSAQPLDKDLLKRLEDSLKQSSIAKNGTLVIESKVNEAILGGLVVDFGDKTVDLSVQSRVNQLNGSLQRSSFSLLSNPELLGADLHLACGQNLFSLLPL